MRKATLDDLPQLVALEQATQAAPWTEDIFKRCLAIHYDCWVMDFQEKILGFVILSTTLTREGHILNLCVDPAYQGQGFGRKMLAYAMSQARQKGIDMVYLEVRRSNTRAISLYDKMNFIQIGERKNYYPGEDALVFALDLRSL